MFNLDELLPHRSPMMLLNHVLKHDLDSAKTEVFITKKSPFFSERQNGVPVWVGIEYMAQTIAVWDGARRLNKGDIAHIAFLLGVRNYTVLANTDSKQKQAVFSVDSKLTITTSPALYDEETGVGVFDCVIESDELRVSARLNACSPENPDPFLYEEL